MGSRNSALFKKFHNFPLCIVENESMSVTKYPLEFEIKIEKCSDSLSEEDRRERGI